MKTIRIQSSDVASQGPFVVIGLTDFNPAIHEPYSDDDAELARSAAASQVGSLKIDSTVIDAARAELSARAAELTARHADLEAEAARQRELAEVLEAERVRLADIAKTLEQGTQEQGMTAAQLKEALTAKGIEFRGNASKADLQALLDAPVA